MKNKINKLIKKYNKIFSEKYGTQFDIREEYSIDSLESLKADCVCDSETTYVECELLINYLNYLKLKETKLLEKFEKMESEEK